MFKPDDANLMDDAIHKRKIFGKIETFYYDAMLNEKYSIVVLINIINFNIFSKVLTGFFIYRDTELIHTNRQRFPLKKVQGSLSQPYMIINNKKIIDTVSKNKNEATHYLISMGNQDYGVELKFTPKTKGWKGLTYLGKWLAIPYFEVSGNIYVNKKQITTEGHGYHDHNIYPIYAPFITKGYDWGKIPIDNINITWAHVIKNERKTQKILVINDNNKYISIDSKDIDIKSLNMKKIRNTVIPTSWKIQSNSDILNLDMTVNSINSHHIKIPSVNFWRHHTKYSGEIQYSDKKSITITGINMIDSLRFL